MPEKLIREYKRASIIARTGATLLYCIGLIGVAIAALHVISLLPSGQSSSADVQQRILSILSALIMAGSVAMLAEFLRHFARRTAPFGHKQSLRLMLASALFALRSFLDALTPGANITVSSESVLSMVPSSQFTVDLKVVVMIVFLACLAMVIRYGDALKEDSDAFI